MKPVSSDVSFPSLEKALLASWRAAGTIEKGLELNADKKPFVFYDGPPFATGLPHYGHILAGTLKDIVPRYWVMKGRYVQRRWGWDCHGLPVEFEMEKELGFNGRHDIENYGVAKFNEACRGIVLRYTKEWEEIISRTGRWVDFKNQYRTMDTNFMESVWWAVHQLWKKGLVFEGYRVMPYSWRISTPLSNFEANLNYREVQDPAVTVRFKSDKGDYSFLAWTTTPWTLPSNLALAVNPELTYVEVEDTRDQKRYVLVEERISAYFKDQGEYREVRRMKGRELEGEGYTPLFPFFADRKKQGAFKVVLGEHVTTTDGTGIVHTAPAFGEEDFEVCRKYKIDLVDPVDVEGNFTALTPPYQGQNVKDADKVIIKDLKAKGDLYRHETLVHNYPFCWRSDTPLIYKAISTWFVRLEPIKEAMVRQNKKTHWVPEHLRDGRFGNWLESARDWNISRNRFWGTPIPIWRCQPECGEMICVGSIDELYTLSGRRPTDIHKHFVDDITIPCPRCTAPMRRIPEVLDCWFESGSMPYGQAHYPFENKEKFEASYPADFIAEGIDQTRGWFYTLTVLGNALLGQVPFRNVIVNGLVLAEDGKKMSKREKNYPDPVYLLDTYGADALRAYLTSSPAAHAEDLRFSENGVKEIVRSVLLPLWNAYSFFVTYATADGWSPAKFDAARIDALSHDLDRWLVSRLQSLVKRVDERMAEYHLYEVVPEVMGFIDQLTNWYIRVNRRRFWSDEDGREKDDAYQTLYFVLNEFCKVLAPILPFVTDEIYRNLRAPNQPESIHLCSFPKVNEDWRSLDLENEMSVIQQVVSMGRNLRNVHKLKTRQPLKEFLVITRDSSRRKPVEKYQSLIATELNVKKVSFSSDESRWVNLTAKANAKVLGPRLGQKMKSILQKVRDLSADAVGIFEKDGKIEIEGETILLCEVTIERQPKQAGVIQSIGSLTVWIDTDVTPSLVQEGRAREFVNRVQKLRKDLNFDVTDRVQVTYQCPGELHDAILNHSEYIRSEVLADKISNAAHPEWTATQDIDGLELKLHLSKS